MNIMTDDDANVFVFHTCNVVFENEIGGDKRVKYRFSDPDGKTGRSGWSFGGSQFDTTHNELANQCLADIGFTNRDIEKIKTQTASKADMDIYNAMLNTKLAKNIIDKYDSDHIIHSINYCLGICKLAGFEYVDPTILIFLVDYHNQLYLSRNGSMHKYLTTIDSDDVLDIDNYEALLKFKLNIKWGKDRPDDVKRRSKNLVNYLDQYDLDYFISTSTKF